MNSKCVADTSVQGTVRASRRRESGQAVSGDRTGCHRRLQPSSIRRLEQDQSLRRLILRGAHVKDQRELRVAPEYNRPVTPLQSVLRLLRQTSTDQAFLF